MKTRVLWHGVESPDWARLSEALFFPEMICEVYHQHIRRLVDAGCDLPETERVAFEKSIFDDATIVQWTNLVCELERFMDIQSNLVSCTNNAGDKPSYHSYFSSGPAYIRARESLKIFLEDVLKQFDTAQLPLKKLDSAALAIERRQASPGPRGSVIVLSTST